MDFYYSNVTIPNLAETWNCSKFICSFFVDTHARIYESFDKLIEKSNNNNIHNKSSVPMERECDEMRGR